ncbi:PilW family protein [Actimicrobium sp. CCI2.3]|uniref:PilW family protein n=1 Tax=Actimicrobium sp. CCI2.3 TaxID=3048616 RepID=UPI002AB52299|nr:PilW family protein [Actimicrobium sp. CCI2.3]MDY7576333.1 PilW family protein [Actimicrobium sp. CCI2.3]MEB0020463.1 PilW family protein [Actimicrobium sp. CCI2.3]
MTARLLRRPSGFTLLELMISITITLFLMAGMLVMVVNMKGSFTTQDQLGRTQENALFVLTILDTTIRHAGYFPDPLVSTEGAAMPATTTANADGTTYLAGQSITGTAGVGAVSDTITVRFQAASNDGLSNCAGDTNKTAGKVSWSNTFAIDANNHLTCTVSVDGGAPAAAVVLIDNVASLRVLYGVDSTGNNNVDRYVSATDIGTTYPYTSVHSVQLSIVLSDLINSTAVTKATLPVLTHTINLMNKTYAEGAS